MFLLRVTSIVFAAGLMVSGCAWKSDLTAKVAEAEGLRKDVASLEERLATTQRELSDLQRSNGDLAREKERLEKDNENIRSALAAKRDQLATEIVDLRNRVIENNARIRNLVEELSGKNTHILELRELVDRLSREKAEAVEEKERAIMSVKSTYDSLVTELKQEIREGEVQITQLKDKLTVNLVDKVLFDSGSAVIKRSGRKVLDRVAEILKPVADRQITVEGHTDNVPIGAGLADRFPTNWELSAARAVTVVRYLQERGVNPSLLSAEGYGEQRPVAPNDSEDGRQKNRRIEIVLIPHERNP